MTEHDPMDLSGVIVESGPVNPWESLARQARWLADQADRLAAMPPADRITTDPDGDKADQLSLLEARELAIRSLLAMCRRSTYRKLLDEHEWSVQEIADELGVSHQAVRKVLNR